MLKYQTIEDAARLNGLQPTTLKLKFHYASRRGIALPPRTRIGRRYLYNVEELNIWLVENAADLKIPSSMTSK